MLAENLTVLHKSRTPCSQPSVRARCGRGVGRVPRSHHGPGPNGHLNGVASRMYGFRDPAGPSVAAGRTQPVDAHQCVDDPQQARAI